MSRNAIVEFLNTGIESALAQTRVCMPARVEKYDAAKQMVDVKPLLQDRTEQEDGTTKYASVPIIRSVPVAFPSGGGFSITFPVAAGDFVLLVVADSSIDTWLSYGTEAEPFDSRQHALTDAFAIPGIHPNISPIANASSSHVTMGNAVASIALKAAGVHLGGQDATEPVLKGDAYHSAIKSYVDSLVSTVATAADTSVSSLTPGTSAALTGAKVGFETALTAALVNAKSQLVKVK